MERAVRGFILTLIIFLKSANSYYGAKEFEAAQIILFYSTLNDSPLIRGQIAIYWFVEDFQRGDILILYYSDSGRIKSKPIFTYYPTELSGFIKTGVPPTEAFYSLDSTYVEQCVGYYGAWLRNNTIKKKSCLSTHPDWMSKHKLQLMDMEIGNLFIPGTHNSGSYSEELPPTILQRYTVTQDRSVLDQLISGARYLDIRPCIYDNKYWVCHGTFKMQPLREIIQDIKEFMENTDEIVIVSFKEFPLGFYSNEDYIQFVVFITKELAEYRYRSSFVQRLSLGDLWKKGQRLILSYHGSFNHKAQYLWTRIVQEWGDVRSIPELYAHINHAENVTRNYCAKYSMIDCLRAVMAEVTLDSSMIIADAAAYYFGRGEKSLREFAIEAGPDVTAWYNDEHFGTANIVAVDFIDATGIVELAIQSNLMRSESLDRR